MCNLRQVYVPLRGDITLHFCEASTVPSGGSCNAVHDSIPDAHAVHSSSGNISRDGDSKDSQNKITVKEVTMSGCTLFPGSQVLLSTH